MNTLASDRLKVKKEHSRHEQASNSSLHSSIISSAKYKIDKVNEHTIN
jgi:hypothetical protein